MRSVVKKMCARPYRAASCALLAATVAGCSADSTRLSGDPFGSPYTSRAGSGEATGSVRGAPAGRVDSRPLSQQPLPPPVASRAPSSGGYQSGVAGGGSGMGSYTPMRAGAYAPASGDITGSAPARPAPQRAAGWNWDGGTPVTITPGETVDGLARKHNVPAAAIRQANGMTASSVLQPGQRLVIPRYDASSMAAMPKPTAPQGAAPAGSLNHVVAPGETMMTIARRYNKPITEIAAANRIAPHAMLKMGDNLIIPGGRKPLAPTPVAAAPQAQPAPYLPPAPPQVAMQRPAAQAAPEQAAVRTITSGAEASADDDATGSAANGPMFRWPVRGHVISNYGSKVNGAQNDGVNLAVPEGTQVRAAGDGVVAYAGAELKGYGNLVLIRHSDGYVTAYAHASEIMVKRNDTVRRGQVIAKSGQTGQVTTPQLHFEIRKGSSPIDPRPLLPAGA